MKVYKIRRGDTLSKIARAHGITLQQLRAANPEIRNPRLIQPGQIIDLPVPVPVPAPGGNAAEAEEASGPAPDTDVSLAIIGEAKRFVNLYEIESNARWDNPETSGVDPEASVLREALEEAGWEEGWPYCAAFCEAVWRLAYKQLGASRQVQASIADNLNPSVMSSFNKWKDLGAISDMPHPGAIFFMQKGRSQKGHAGIVVRVFADTISTIEGNTSPDPADADADREGDGVFKRSRTLNFQHSPGLWMRGFLNPLPLH